MFTDSLVVNLLTFNSESGDVCVFVYVLLLLLNVPFRKESNLPVFLPSFLVSSPWHVSLSLSDP